MKKTILFCAAAALLCACAGNVKKTNQVSDAVWEQSPMDMCASLIEQNKTALETIRSKYGAETAQAAAALYQELDLRSNAVCRSRIARWAQNEQIKELRAEYIGKINAVIRGRNAK